MAGESGYKIKLLHIIDILRRETDEDHILTANQLCEELEKYNIKAERKSVYKDIEVLREFGYDIVHVRSPKNGFFIANRLLDNPEVRLLVDAVQAADFIPEEKSYGLIMKLLNFTSSHKAKKIMQGVCVKRNSKCGSDDVLYVTDILHQAIEEGKKVSIKYGRRCIAGRKLDVETKSFRLNPYALIWANNHYYLIANYDKYDNLMHLRVDRILKARITSEEARHFSEVSEYKEKFDHADYAEKVFNMFSGEVMDIELICSNTLIEDMSDRFGADAEYKPYNPGQFILSVRAGVSEGLVSWLLQFGGRVKIKSPESLKELYHKRVKELAENAGIIKA